MSRALKKPKDNKQILKKHVSVIHINANLSLLQRKLMNALLYNAYDGLLTDNQHTISTSVLCEMIGFDSKNLAYLKASLKGFMETVIEFDVMEDDGEQAWEAMVLIPYVKIKGGTCTYRFERALAEKLYHPDMYSKINLSILREMKSSHALVLYENCFRYADIGHTAWWDVDVFRKLMAVDQMSSYKPFKALNRNVIQPAMKEVNKLSNIHVEMETRMKGRSVTGLRFLIKPNPQLSLIGMEEDDDITMTQAYKSLIREGISKTLARSWVIEHGEEYILGKLEYANDQATSGKIKSSKTGFLKSAIEQDFKHEKEIKREQQKAVDEARAQKRKLEYNLESTREALRAAESAYRAKCTQTIQETFDALPEAEKEAVSAEFEQGLSARVFVQDFKKSSWDSRSVFLDALAFWKKRGTPLPSSEEFSKENPHGSIDEMRQKVKGLEEEMKRKY